MVATQSFSISRRALDVEDYIDIGRRHAGWIVGPAFFGVVVSICVAFVLPNQYTSKATMQITPAEINENMIQSTISNSLNERIQQMETSILSRTELSSIINDPRLMLYQDDLKTKPLEDVIEEMKSKIDISFVALPGALGRRASAFNIQFTYKDKYKAKETVAMLMNKFDEENTNTQKTTQDVLKGLVGDLLNNAKAELQDAQDKLTVFKESHAGELPNQAELNIARENGYTEKIRSADTQIYRDQQALANYETEKSAAKEKLAFSEAEQTQLASLVLSPGAPGAQQNLELAKLDQYIDQLEFTLRDLHKRFSDKYPEIKNQQMQLDSFKTRREELAKKLEAKAAADAAKAAADAEKPKEAATTLAGLRTEKMRFDVDEELKRIDAQEKLLNDDIEKAKKEQDIYRKESDEVNQMLKDSTGIEGEYEALNQAKVLAETTYNDYEKKQQVEDASGQLISRKAGENLDVLDNASLPGSPTSPKRYQIIGAGFAMSIILGLGMAGLQEAKDTSLKNLKDVRAYTNLPVLCSIPLLENTMLVKRKRRLTYLAWAAAVLVGAAAVSGALVYYYTITRT